MKVWLPYCLRTKKFWSWIHSLYCSTVSLLLEFPELVKTGFWAIWVEQHAPYIYLLDFCPEHTGRSYVSVPNLKSSYCLLYILCLLLGSYYTYWSYYTYCSKKCGSYCYFILLYCSSYILYILFSKTRPVTFISTAQSYNRNLRVHSLLSKNKKVWIMNHLTVPFMSYISPLSWRLWKRVE